MINHYEVLALRDIALKDPEYFQRKVCRYFSEHFHTPLLEVYDLPWPFVFTNYLEHIVESNHGQESIYNLAIDICYPEYRQEEEEEVEDWIKKIEEEEEAKRQAAHALANPPIEEPEEEMEEKPEINMESTSFAHLEEEMEEDS